MFLSRQLTLSLPLALVVACTAETTGTDGGTPAPGADATAGADAAPIVRDDAGQIVHPDAAVPDSGGDGLARSDKARVRWKGEPILRSELASALALPGADLCKELGTFDCFSVHRVALGGVEPYTLGINEPFPDTAVTAPLAIERVALSGCRTRVDLDLATPASAVIFRDLPGDALPDLDAPAVRGAIDRLYARFTSRAPHEDEARALLDLYADVTAANEPRPARAWAILSCFAVATSIESLFY